jgi:hypothetical protein
MNASAYTNSQPGRWLLLLAPVMVGLAFASVALPALPESVPAVRRDFSAFKLISDRNIFDSNRSRSRSAGPVDKAARVDTITLYGTFIYEKGPFAFFTGSSPEYQQVLNAGKSIAGYTIAAISGSGVTLVGGTNTIDFRVGMQLRQEEGGPWLVVAESAPARGGDSPATGSAASSGGDDNDLVKKMMKQREEELK